MFSKIVSFINKINCSVSMFFIYLILFPVYLYSTKVYAYIGYYQFTGFSILRFVFSSFLVIFFIYYGNNLKSEFLKITYKICLVFLLYGELVSYVLDSTVNLVMIVIVSVFLISFYFCDKFKLNLNFRICDGLDSKTQEKFIFILSIFLFLPFLKYINSINLNNLLLVDIYETRTQFGSFGQSAILLGYIKEPLARVLLPLLLIIGINKRKKMYIISSSFMILYIFLCGGLKSIMFGLICALAFYPFSYKKKSYNFINSLLIVGILGIVIYYIFNIDIIISIFRRVFIIPARLNKYYVEYYTDNWTYYNHSGFSLNQDIIYKSGISNYVGDYIIGTGVNANTGIFVEGYYSFGLFGAILYLLIPFFIITFFNSINFDSSYYGIFFIYIYYSNTAILSTLCLTHGLLFFMFIALFFMIRKNNRFILNGRLIINNEK